jgi:hypothetical protein
MKRVPFLALLFSLGVLAVSCRKEDETPPLTINDSFAENTAGWSAGFSDHPVLVNKNDSSLYELSAKWAALPNGLSAQKGGFQIQGHNRSDDLFMYIKKQVKNLQANTTYRIEYQVTLASDAAKGSVGIGGSPAESVYFKAGASSIEPNQVKKGEDWRMNIDKNEQSQSGKDMIVIGDMSNGTSEEKYKVIERSSAGKTIEAKTNDKGELWLILGTDSGYEGLTKMYYLRVKAELSIK